MRVSEVDVSAFGYKQELSRSLSIYGLLTYGLVFIVPIAPIPLFGIVFNASRGMVPLVYLIGLAAMMFTALSYMTMAEEFPVAGSVYTYASRSLGPVFGFFSGWALLLDYLLIPTLIYIACAIAVHSSLPEVSRPLCVVVMLVTATIINYFGIKTAARASFILLGFQLLIILMFFGLGVRGVMHHLAGAHISLVPFYNPAEFTPRLVFGALSIAVLTFLGFDAISTLSEESIGGGAAVGRATLLALGISAALFVTQTWLASLFVLDRTRLDPGSATNAAFYDIAELLGGYWFKFLLAVPGLVLSSIAGAVTAQAATARILFGMARDGELPRALAHVDPQRHVPVRAILLVAALTLVLGLVLVDRLEVLSEMVSFGALVGFLMLHVSVIVYFLWHKRSRNWWRHFASPLIGLCIVGYVLINAQSIAKIAGMLWMVGGAFIFGTLRLLHRRSAVTGGSLTGRAQRRNELP